MRGSSSAAEKPNARQRRQTTEIPRVNGDGALRAEPKRRRDNRERFARAKKGFSAGSPSAVHDVADFSGDCGARLAGIDLGRTKFIPDEGIAGGESGVSGEMGRRGDDL